MIIDTTLTKMELEIRKRVWVMAYVDELSALLQRQKNSQQQAIIKAMLSNAMI